MTHSYVGHDSLIGLWSSLWHHSFIQQFPLKVQHPRNPPNREFRIPRFSRYKFKLRSWFNLNLYQGIWVSGFDGFGERSICTWICHRSLKSCASHVGFLKSQFSFAEYSLFYRSLLQKRPVIFSQAYVWRDSFTCETRLTRMCDCIRTFTSQHPN